MASAAHIKHGTLPRMLVLGGGPAGAAAALGLRRLGYPVRLITVPRSFAAVEGVSERVVAGLHSAGFAAAMTTIVAPTPRNAVWNGGARSANSERLVFRPALDAALLEVLAAERVEVCRGRVCDIGRGPHGHEVSWEGERGVVTQSADFLIEARGRSAPFSGRHRQRGPETLCLLQRWQGPAMPARSGVESFEDGWAWCAALPDGSRYLQLALDARGAAQGGKADLAELCLSRWRQMETPRAFLDGASPVAPVAARASTAVLAAEVVGDDWIRVGDAAMALDPLSGNGIFQSLSSALLAPAVVNTMLQRPADAALAQEFYRQRADHLFFRMARIGRDFYRAETRWAEAPFWQARSAWPDAEPAHAEPGTGELACAQRPVIHDGFIERRQVVVTPDRPLGIWRLDGVELAPLLATFRRLPPAAGEPIEAWLRSHFGVSERQARNAGAWLDVHAG